LRSDLFASRSAFHRCRPSQEPSPILALASGIKVRRKSSAWSDPVGSPRSRPWYQHVHTRQLGSSPSRVARIAPVLRSPKLAFGTGWDPRWCDRVPTADGTGDRDPVSAGLLPLSDPGVLPPMRQGGRDGDLRRPFDPRFGFLGSHEEDPGVVRDLVWNGSGRLAREGCCRGEDLDPDPVARDRTITGAGPC
jgi:hypothetical protein